MDRKVINANTLSLQNWSFVFSAFASACGLLVILPKLRKHVLSRINRCLSFLINQYLLFKYPICHNETGRSIPTCPYVFPNGQGNVAKFLEGLSNAGEWSRQYGSVYRIWSGTKPEIVLSRPEHVKAVFYDSDRHTKAKDNNSGYLMHQILGQCLGLISGKSWANLKEVVQTPFTYSSTTNHVQLVQRMVAEYIQELFDSKTADELHPANDLKMLPFWITAQIIYGDLTPAMKTELQQLATARESLFRHVIRGGISRFAISRFLPTQTNRDLSSFLRRWQAFNDKAAAAAETATKTTTTTSPTSTSKPPPPPPITQMYRSLHNGTSTRPQLLQTLDEILFANLDVTTGGLSWLVTLIASSSFSSSPSSSSPAPSPSPPSPPTLLSTLRTSLSLYPSRSHPQTPLLSSSSSPSSSLLQAFTLESSRLHPIAAFSVPQSAPTSRLLDGFTIPAGTDFIVDATTLNTNKEFWGEDAGEFRPQRFLEGGGEVKEGKEGKREMRYNYWRFGFGPRVCLGRYLADLILRAVVAELVGGYEIEVPREWQEQGGKGKEKRVDGVWISQADVRLKWWKRGEGGEGG